MQEEEQEAEGRRNSLRGGGNPQSEEKVGAEAQAGQGGGEAGEEVAVELRQVGELLHTHAAGAT